MPMSRVILIPRGSGALIGQLWFKGSLNRIIATGREGVSVCVCMRVCVYACVYVCYVLCVCVTFNRESLGVEILNR